MQEQTDTIPQLTEKKAAPKKNTPAKRVSTKSVLNKSTSVKKTDISLSDKKSDPVNPVAKKKISTNAKKALVTETPSTPLQSTENEALSPTQRSKSHVSAQPAEAKTARSRASATSKTTSRTVAKKSNTAANKTVIDKTAKSTTKTAAQINKQTISQKLNRYSELPQEDSSELICVLEKASVLNKRPLSRKAPFLATYKLAQVTEPVVPARNLKNKTQKTVQEPAEDYKELSFKTLVRALKAKWLKKNTLDEIADTDAPLLPSAPMPTPRTLDLKSRDPLAPFKGKFDKESINELPLVHYEGEICLVNTIEAIEPALELLKNDTILGFDTETKPNFHKGKTPPPCLLQLAGENAVVLFQFKHAGFCQALADILHNPKIIKSGIAVADDVRGLNRLLEFQANNMIDMTAIMKKAGLETFGMRNMAANLLGVRISKSAQCSNWSNSILTPQQIRYAATDAWISRLLYMRARELNLISD